MNEEEYSLIQQCQQGDTTAYKHLFLKYKDTVYNVACGMLSNVEDAQDMTQEVFIRVFEKINQFSFKSSFSTWLYRVTVNMCKNELRKRQKQDRETENFKNYYEQMQTSIENPENEILKKERKSQIRQALFSLKDSHQTILVLREIEGLSYKELAKVLKCSLGRVKSRLHEARMELRTEFKSLEAQKIKGQKGKEAKGQEGKEAKGQEGKEVNGQEGKEVNGQKGKEVREQKEQGIFLFF